MYDFTTGEVILIDKPLQWTSFDVVKKIRNLVSKYIGVKKIKVGHAGTLDPLASGLLIVCTGKKTKTIEEIQSQKKEYTGTIHLGATTASYDLETEIENEVSVEHLSAQEVEKSLEHFKGKLHQLPPIYSAKKVDGKRAYEMARKGKEVKIQPNQITIHELEIRKMDLPELEFRVVCSKGTYIRSLANDIGVKLGVGAYLKTLRRTQIGNYKLKDAISVEEFEQQLFSV